MMNSSHKIKQFSFIVILVLLSITLDSNGAIFGHPILSGSNNILTSNEPFPINVQCKSFDDYAVYASDRIGIEPNIQLYCLASQEKNEIIMAVVDRDENGIFKTLLTTKPILSYKQFLSGKAQILFDPDTLHTYFWYTSDYLEIYLLCYEKEVGSYAVCRGEYKTNGQIITFDVDKETNDYIIVAPLTYPQIKWPFDTSKLKMDNFDFAYILGVCRDALKYLDNYTDTHVFEDDSESLYEIIW